MTFLQFVRREYAECKYRDSYTFVEFFNKTKREPDVIDRWLSELKGQPISARFCFSLARTYHRHFNVTAKGMPYVLVFVERHYQLTLPEVAGILTPEYWQSRLPR
ncbi:hypothetical protein QTV44_002478 [Vibrio vulnificus]|nr:hypothetical protein [Vibrio vulnificus]